MITVQDITQPIITGVPTNISVTCGDIPAPATGIIATDNCDTDVSITFEETQLAGSCTDNYTLVRTWTATDDCGNAIAGTQMIQVEDTENPILIGVPVDVTVLCGELPPPPVDDVVATDDCDTNVEVYFTEELIAGACANTYTLIRTWTASDNCGNLDVQTQTISVGDNAAPEITGVPANETISCEELVSPASPTATDDCDGAIQAFLTEEIIGGACSENYTIVRVWTATDNCGNVTTASQTVAVEDNAAPILIGVPNDLTADCNEVPPLSLIHI